MIGAIPNPKKAFEVDLNLTKLLYDTFNNYMAVKQQKDRYPYIFINNSIQKLEEHLTNFKLNKNIYKR
jgi:hypothetical protein